MQHLINIRKKTGIPQTSLAALLGMTRQSLAKVEKGICNLSSSNQLKISRLLACIESLQDADVTKQMPVQKTEADSKREKECRYFITVLQRKLARREASYKKRMHLYGLLSMLEPTDEGDELWVQKTKNKIINKLDRCGPAACMRLRKRIYLLTAEADYISRFVNENQSSS